jgi:hypothetical protein
MDQPHAVRAVGVPFPVLFENQRIGGLCAACTLAAVMGQFPGIVLERHGYVTSTATLPGQGANLFSKALAGSFDRPVVDV